MPTRLSIQCLGGPTSLTVGTGSLAAVAQPITDRAQSSDAIDARRLLDFDGGGELVLECSGPRPSTLCSDCPLSPLAFAAPIGAGNEHAVPHTRQSVSLTCPPQARPCHGGPAARARGTPAPCQPLFAAPRMDGAHRRPAARAPPARAPATATAPPSTTLSRGGAGRSCRGAPRCVSSPRAWHLSCGSSLPPPTVQLPTSILYYLGRTAPPQLSRSSTSLSPMACSACALVLLSTIPHSPPTRSVGLPPRVFPFCHSPLPASSLREDR